MIVKGFTATSNNLIIVHPDGSEGYPCDSAGKESVCKAGDLGSIPGLGRSPGERERIPTLVFWPGEFYRLPMWSQRVRHD